MSGAAGGFYDSWYGLSVAVVMATMPARIAWSMGL